MTDHERCSCAHHADGSTTTYLCRVHATIDPCLTKALTTGKRRRGTIRGGTCSHCGWTEEGTNHTRTHARDARHMSGLDSDTITNASMTAGG
jgi:hypothetical protein